jgi:hypothetical protein
VNQYVKGHLVAEPMSGREPIQIAAVLAAYVRSGLLLECELVEVMACPSIGDVMDTTEACATASKVLERFLASYWTTRTRANYRFILARWLDWCHANGYDPLGGADAAALESFIAELKTAGYAPDTIVGRVSAISAFYRWCVREQLWFATRWSSSDVRHDRWSRPPRA